MASFLNEVMQFCQDFVVLFDCFEKTRILSYLLSSSRVSLARLIKSEVDSTWRGLVELIFPVTGLLRACIDLADYGIGNYVPPDRPAHLPPPPAVVQHRSWWQRFRDWILNFQVEAPVNEAQGGARGGNRPNERQRFEADLKRIFEVCTRKYQTMSEQIRGFIDNRLKPLLEECFVKLQQAIYRYGKINIMPV